MKYDVFISYSHRDYIDEHKNVIPGNIISALKDLFDKNDISYWVDENGVYSGDHFAKVIAQNIKDSYVFLFVSTTNSNSSEWTSGEIAVAHQYKKQIIPFLFDSSTYNESFILYLAKLDFIPYFSNPEVAMTTLVTTIMKVRNETKEREVRKEIKKLLDQWEQKEQEQQLLFEQIKRKEAIIDDKTAEVSHRIESQMHGDYEDLREKLEAVLQENENLKKEIERYKRTGTTRKIKSIKNVTATIYACSKNKQTYPGISLAHLNLDYDLLWKVYKDNDIILTLETLKQKSSIEELKIYIEQALYSKP